MTIHEAYRLSELEEVLGRLHSIKANDIGMVAIIGKVSILLPGDMADKLQGLVGKRIGILRLDGYHIRCLDDPRHQI